MAVRSRRVSLYPPITLEEGLQLGLDAIEWESIVDRLGRDPNHFESSVFATLWSDRISFKNSKALLEAANIEHGDLVPLLGSSLRILNLDENTQLVLRIAQQNKLCDIDPGFGAEGSLDQALLELTALGATPLVGLGVGRFGNPERLNQQQRFKRLIKGLANFGNRFGLPILGGDYYFHKRYNKAPLVNTGVLGIINSKREERKNKLPYGSPILYVGAKTGFDILDKSSIYNCERNTTIPIGDPLAASRLIRASKEALEKGLAEEIIVVGAGGLAVATFNMSTRLGQPILLDIDRIPLRQEGLKPLEIILSESADRLLIITSGEKHRELNNVLYKWDLTSTRVGEVNDADGIEYYWNHYKVADIPFHFAVGGVISKTIDVVKFPPMLKRAERDNGANDIRRKKKMEQDDWTLIREVNLKAELSTKEKVLPIPSNLEDTWLDLLANPNLSSKHPIYSSFDQLVGGRSLLKAGMDSGVVRIGNKSSNSEQALALSVTSNSLYVMMEPYLGTVQTIAESMRNLASVGARCIGLSTCLNFGNPSEYRDICDLAEAVRGLGDASRIWNIPLMSEEVSLGNGDENNPVMPTPVVIGLGLIADDKNLMSPTFKNKGDIILLLGHTKNEIGCSEYAHYVHKQVNNLVPDIDFAKEKKRCDDIVDLIETGLLQSCHDLGRGGLALALVESCLLRDRPIGAALNILEAVVPEERNAAVRPDSYLFSETSSRFLVSCKAEDIEKVKEFLLSKDIHIGAEGEVGGKNIEVSGAISIKLPLSTTYKLWVHRLESYLYSANKDNSLNS
jgi:phosphoribosylformylglycinamidine (FGAM) synthase-like enzyme